MKEAINLKIFNNDLIYEISDAFVACGQDKTARKALEYALLTRANKSGQQKQMKKVPEFLMQVGKVDTELEKQKLLNNTDYAGHAENQIKQMYKDILIKTGVLDNNDKIGSLLLELYVRRVRTLDQ